MKTVSPKERKEYLASKGYTLVDKQEGAKGGKEIWQNELFVKIQQHFSAEAKRSGGEGAKKILEALTVPQNLALSPTRPNVTAEIRLSPHLPGAGTWEHTVKIADWADKKLRELESTNSEVKALCNAFRQGGRAPVSPQKAPHGQSPHKNNHHEKRY